MRASSAGRFGSASVAGLLAGALLLAGCASSQDSGAPNWKPKPSFSGEGYSPPADQQPVQPRNPQQQPSGSPSQSPGSTKKGTDPAVVATHLTAPTGIAILPDNTALVGERTTGRIVRVQPQPGKPVQTVRTLAGLSFTGDGGLLDLTLSPHYAQDKLIFAYVSTRADNRVVAFTLNGPVTPVLTGIPHGTRDNAGRIAFAADGNLLVATGDAGRPALALNTRSLAGKVLRVTDIGTPASGNPTRGSRVFASGFAQTNGLCTVTGQLTYLQVGSRPQLPADPIFQITPGGIYGSRTTDQQPIVSLPQTAREPGGCAVLKNLLFTTTRDGKALLSAPIKQRGAGVKLGAFSRSLRNKYGRLLTVVGAPDGALWLTTSNKDGQGTPVATDERVLRIVPAAGGGGGNNPL